MKTRLQRVLNWRRTAQWTRTRRWTVIAACAGALLMGALMSPAAPDGQVYKVGGDVSSPVLVVKHEPEYSKEAKDAKLEGIVLLHVVITEEGKVKDVQVVKGLGSGLDEKAVEAVSSWLFKPGVKAGKPVAVTASIEIHFRLLDDPAKKN